MGNHSLPDHRAPSPVDLRRFQYRAQTEGAEWLVCTAKDSVKLGPEHAAVLDLPLWVAEQSVLGGRDLLGWVITRLEQITPS